MATARSLGGSVRGPHKAAGQRPSLRDSTGQIVKEAGSELARRWLREDADLIVRALTRLELISAVEQMARERQAAEREGLKVLTWPDGQPP